MEKKFRITECELIPTEGTTLSENYGLLNGSPVINYYESLKSPAISVNLSFLDVDGVVSNESIMGGEMLRFTVDFGELGTFSIDENKHKLMVGSVNNVRTQSSKQTATLDAISVESFINETARIAGRYKDANIADTVKKLIGEGAGIRAIKTDKNVLAEPTSNKYNFVGNMRRPIDTIQWLCPKASSSSNHFGYLFYETYDGYNFRSIDTLLKQPSVKTFSKTEISSVDDSRILNEQFNYSNDIGMALRMGMYANNTGYFDIRTGTFGYETFTVDDLDLKKPPKLPGGLGESPSRLMFRILDVGALQEGDAVPNSDQKPQDLAKYQNKSYARNNLIFSQSLNIVVPCDPTLRAGQVITVELPLPTSDQKNKQMGDGTRDLSGDYLISELKHEIGGNKAYTQLSLIRDTFTATA